MRIPHDTIDEGDESLHTQEAQSFHGHWLSPGTLQRHSFVNDALFPSTPCAVLQIDYNEWWNHTRAFLSKH